MSTSKALRHDKEANPEDCIWLWERLRRCSLVSTEATCSQSQHGCRAVTMDERLLCSRQILPLAANIHSYSCQSSVRVQAPLM